MKQSDFKRTSLSILLPNGSDDLREWLASKYYERFGTDELIVALNSGDRKKAKVIWDEIRNNPSPTLTQSEFKKWFMALDKMRPEGVEESKWIYSMISMGSIMGPPVIEDTDEFLAKPLFTDEQPT